MLHDHVISILPHNAQYIGRGSCVLWASRDPPFSPPNLLPWVILTLSLCNKDKGDEKAPEVMKNTVSFRSAGRPTISNHGYCGLFS